MTAPLLDPAKDTAKFDDRVDAVVLVKQIGRGNLMAISGGRASRRATGVTLPVGAGYSVHVDLAADDTYTVRRIFKRGQKVWIKGEQTGVYAEDLGETAYQASCYVNVKFGDHDPMA